MTLSASADGRKGTRRNGPLRVGIGGPVGSGKTTLVEKLCKAARGTWSIGVVTNDIYTREDAEALVRLQALPADRIIGVETGGCPHTAIREDASINIAAIRELNARHRDLDLVLVESGGDNLAATFSPDLVDLSIYVISVCQGDDIPRKGGPAITRSDLLVINKTDLAPYVGADLDRMRQDAARGRGEGPTLFCDLSRSRGSATSWCFLRRWGGFRSWKSLPDADSPDAGCAGRRPILAGRFSREARSFRPERR